VKQADVPARAHQAQKLQQRAGALGEHKAQQALVLRQAEWPPTMWRNVLLGQLVVRQVQRFKPCFVEVGRNLGDSPLPCVVRPTNTWAVARR
jgi:hypothetical protein